MTAIYLTMVFSLLVCFILRWAKIQSEFLLRLFKTGHRPVLVALLVNIVLMQFHWSFTGSYTNQVLILLTVLSGIFTYALSGNNEPGNRPSGYYRLFFSACFIFTLLGAVPLVFPYGAGLVFQLAARNYTTYPLSKTFFLKTRQDGVNNCLHLSLCKRYLWLEREIPVYQKTDTHYDCFNDVNEVSIRESRDKGLTARIICAYHTDTTFLHLNEEESKLQVIRHAGYGIKTYKIDFANFQYKVSYASDIPDQEATAGSSSPTLISVPPLFRVSALRTRNTL